jgi:AmmeMemoRadiSam system protein B
MKFFAIKNINIKRSGLIAVCFFALVAVLSFLNLQREGLSNFEVAKKVDAVKFGADPNDKEFYEAAFGFKKKKMEFSSAPVAMIVPHHLLAADLIAEAFSNLPANEYETVVLISPDHFNIGQEKILSLEIDWTTPYGDLSVDKEFFLKLKKDGLLFDNDDVFKREHGIRGEVSFIKKTMPNAKILPLVVKSTLSGDEVEKLSKALFEFGKQKKILVILSADFSHYKTNAQAQADDQKTLAVIKDLATDRISEAEIDTRPGLLVVMRYAKLRGASFDFLNNSNSALLIGRDDIRETTSYITGYFSNP